MPGVVRAFEGRRPRIDDTAFIADNATVIGDVEIGADSSIWYGSVVRGDVNAIRIGRDTNIQDGTVIHVNHDRLGDGGMRTVIGDRVTVGHLAMLHACVLETGAFVGMRATVMDAAVVEGGGMLAAGALLTPGKRVRSGQLWAGSPAKFRRDLTQDEIDYIPYVNRHYVQLAARHRAEQSG